MTHSGLNNDRMTIVNVTAPPPVDTLMLTFKSMLDRAGRYSIPEGYDHATINPADNCDLHGNGAHLHESEAPRRVHALKPKVIRWETPQVSALLKKVSMRPSIR